MDDLTDSITVENVVASSDVGQELALDPLDQDLAGAEYNPENFPGAVYRM
jgi:transcription initiation factor TFIID TATA-box-binding protein